MEIKKPELLGMCCACHEYTDAYEPCCGASVFAEGSNEYWEDLRSNWEEKTGFIWEEVFGE